jgi:hypothetical protein
MLVLTKAEALKKRNKITFKRFTMKTQLLLIVLLLSSVAPIQAQYQFQIMEDDFLQIGAGNYFVHLDKEAEVKKTVMSVLKAHRFPHQDLLFNKDKNLYFASYYVNPSDDRFVYIIHAVRAREGYDLYFLYCHNILTHHFEFAEGKDLHQLVYDPAINTSSVFTSFNATKIETK